MARLTNSRSGYVLVFIAGLINSIKRPKPAMFARSLSVKIILAIAAELDMILDSCILRSNPEEVQLTHCVYVLATASAYFRYHSDATLKGIGFKPTISDPQVYTLREKTA